MTDVSKLEVYVPKNHIVIYQFLENIRNKDLLKYIIYPEKSKIMWEAYRSGALLGHGDQYIVSEQDIYWEEEDGPISIRTIKIRVSCYEGNAEEEMLDIVIM